MKHHSFSSAAPDHRICPIFGDIWVPRPHKTSEESVVHYGNRIIELNLNVNVPIVRAVTFLLYLVLFASVCREKNFFPRDPGSLVYAGTDRSISLPPAEPHPHDSVPHSLLRCFLVIHITASDGWRVSVFIASCVKTPGETRLVSLVGSE